MRKCSMYLAVFALHKRRDPNTVTVLHDYFLWKGLCWISVEFHCYFPFFIKYCHILFIIIVFWLGCDRPSGLLFFRARFASFHTHASLLVFFVCFFILFHSCCSHARVFGKTLVHEFPVIISIFGSTGSEACAASEHKGSVLRVLIFSWGIMYYWRWSINYKVQNSLYF